VGVGVGAGPFRQSLVRCRLPGLRDECVLDRLRDLREWSLTGRLDTGDPEDPVAVRRADRADQPVLGGPEDRRCEPAVERVLREGGDLAARAIGRFVDRVPLRYGAMATAAILEDPTVTLTAKDTAA
jgi:hypothetical protein